MLYFAIVHKDKGSAYGVTFPDLPGCFSAADEIVDVLPHAQAALALYASGETSLPVARSIEDMTKEKEIQSALAAGAFVIAVPLVVSDKKIRANVMFERSLLEAVDRQAQSTGISRSEYLAQAARRKLQTDGAVVLERDASGRMRALT